MKLPALMPQAAGYLLYVDYYDDSENALVIVIQDLNNQFEGFGGYFTEYSNRVMIQALTDFSSYGESDYDYDYPMSEEIISKLMDFNITCIDSCQVYALASLKDLDIRGL